MSIRISYSGNEIIINGSSFRRIELWRRKREMRI